MTLNGHAPATLTRTPPHDVAAEQAVLGAVMLNRDVLADVLDVVSPADFYRPEHETIMRAMVGLYNQGEPVDAVSVAAALTKSGELAKVGGHDYLHELVAATPAVASATYYAQIVRDAAVRRDLLTAATRIAQRAIDATGDVEELVDEAEQAVFRVADSRTGDKLAVPSSDWFPALVDELQAGPQAREVLSTGLRDLDDRLDGGLEPGQFVVIAARPGMGKTILCSDIARAVARTGRGVLFFTLEISRRDMAKRLTAAEAGVEYGRVKTGELSEDDWRKIAQSPITSWNLSLVESPATTITTIRSTARRMAASRPGLGLIVLDYLQLLQGLKAESRQVEVATYSRSLKLLAKELGVPVVAACQLNRAPEHRNDKRPMLADLRESGAIEMDADVVILIHRPDMYGEEDRLGEADLIIAKNRSGPVGTVPVAAISHRMTFRDLHSH